MLPRFFATGPEAQAQVREQAEEMMRFHLQSFEDTLEHGPWLLGERWSILDADHFARLLTRPSVTRALATEARAQGELEAQGLAIAGLKNR